jgi:hypothetical protein
LAAAALLFACALAFYYPLVFLGRALVDYDAFVYFYPQRAFLARSLLDGELPLWNPYLFLGAPFLANPQTAVLYPPSWLFVLGPVFVGYSVQLVLHAFLASVFTYLLVRRAYGLLPQAGVVAGLGYGFGGFVVGQAGHLNQLSAAAWVPAVLLAYTRLLQTRHVRWIALGGLALALQLLAGHPQETYMTLVMLGLFGLIQAPWRSPGRLVQAGLGGFAMCILGAALAAAQLLPTLELAPLSIRAEGVSWRDAVSGSLPSYLAVRALLPPYWIDVPYTEYLGYIGVTHVALALLAVLLAAARPALFGGLVCLLGILLALGENDGLYAWAFATVPGFDTFRVPARWLLLWQFGAAVLAGAGADWIGRGARAILRQRSLWPRVFVAAGLLAIGLAWQVNEGEPFGRRATPLAWGALAATTLASGVLTHLRRPGWALGLLVLLAGAEVWAAGNAAPARQAPPPAFTPGQTIDWLSGHAPDAGMSDRVLSLARPEYVPAAEGRLRQTLRDLPEPLIQSLLIAQKWHDTLTPNVPLEYGLASADGYDGGVLPLDRWLVLSRLLVPDPRPDGVLLSRLASVPDDRLLDLIGVRYLVANQGTAGRPSLDATDLGDLRLFARPSPVPRALLVFAATPVLDEAAGLTRLADGAFDPNQEVVVEAPATGLSSNRPSQRVEPQAESAGHWRARVMVPAPAYLLQRDAWYPGWRARVDGREVPIARADVLFRAVALSPGEHEVELSFVSDTFQRGALISLVALLAVAWLLIGTAVPIILRGGPHR